MQDTVLKTSASLATLPSAAMLLDHKGHILDWNPACSKLLGFKKNEVLRTHVDQLLKNTKHEQSFFHMALRHRLWQGEKNCLHKNGEIVRCQMHMAPLSEDKQFIITLHNVTLHYNMIENLKKKFDTLLQKSQEQTSMLHMANSLLEYNISERDTIDKVLRDNEKRFRLLAENATDIVAQLAPDYRYLYVSPSCQTLLGYPSQKMVGKKMTDFIHTGDLQKLGNTLYHEPSLDEKSTLTYRLRKKDGNYLWFETTLRYIKDNKKNNIVEIHASSRDITYRISEEKSRLRSQKIAKVFRLNTMEEMASGMAHEINQPLSAIVNYIQGCIRYLENQENVDTEKLMHIMEKASDQARRAGEIIHRLKNFFSKGKLYKTPEKMTKLIRESVELIKDEITNAGVTIQYKIEKNLPVIMVDKIQIQQVILNLIQNAIEAMGEVDREKRKITLKISKNDIEKKIEFMFRDTGPGFSEEISEKIFQVFFTTKSTGTGMGLPISRSIVEAHGGKFLILTASNPTGSGVCFKLPITEHKRR